MRVYSSTKIWPQAGFLLVALMILVGDFALQTQYLLWGDWTYDQGFYFLVARLMEQGFWPYRQIHMSEQPLMVWSAYLPYELFDSVWAMQFFMVAYALLGIAALISIGRRLAGIAAGLLAGFLYAAHFEFFKVAYWVNPETTSVSLALVAIALALRYSAEGRRRWLIFSAIALAGSFLLKLFMMIAIPLIALILLLYPAFNNFGQTLRQRRHKILTDYLLWFGAIVAILLTVWLGVGISGWLEQSVFFYINRNAAHPFDLAFNLSQIWQLLVRWPLLLVLSLFGLGRALVQFKSFGWIAIIWTLLSLTFLLTFTPLREKHLIMLIPLQAFLAALGLSQFFTLWRVTSRQQPIIKWGTAFAGLLLTGLLLAELAAPFSRLTRPNKPLVEGESEIVAEALLKFTNPADCIITDDPYVAFVAGRLPPPWLSNLSYARFESGSLTTRQLIEVTNRYNCQAVVPTLDRLKNSDRAYYDWAKATYLRTWVVEGKEIMLGKPLTRAAPRLPLYANFAGQVELLGADWIKAEAQPGQVYVSLYWKSLKPFTQNYKIFVHLRHAATGQTVASADHEAFDGLLPTQRWPVNRILKDTNPLVIPVEAPPGPYLLYVGLYDPATGKRLPIINDQSGENAVMIPGIGLE